MSAISEFERIEALVKDGSVQKLSTTELQKMQGTLLRSTPTSSNPQFVQRWERVNLALSNELQGKLAWWQRPLGVIAIAVLSAVLSAAVTTWLGLK
jgi:hypothetical protein